MNHPKLPSTVMHDLINVNLICKDRLKVSYVLKDYLCINEQIFATILRSLSHLNLKNLFNDCIKDSIQYVQEENHIIEKTHRNLRNFHFVKQQVQSYRRVYELEITLGSRILEIINESKIPKKLAIQFIYHPCVTSSETYLMAFDLDIIQICFNGEKVLSTWACIRALNTGAFICYNLTNDLVTLGRSAVRIGKYYQRNFKLLYPHQFQIDNFFISNVISITTHATS
ncbi:unnamed protein product [Rotaria socialis]|uniref:Uncharacterized protein n=1 Tax=Rotaria socialis TaxID=392032 RepID=A0A818YD42_9BILA|nr:unnamed protein product [Rotaria socialis]CAF4614389.1 unnamed protein product [Rotaria socialis]